MRIQEEQDRRRREAEIHERLPRSLEEVHRALAGCIESYRRAFGDESAEIQLRGPEIAIAVRENERGEWQERAVVTVALAPALPGFRIEREGNPLTIEVGAAAR